jgi:hypothetical protein
LIPQLVDTLINAYRLELQQLPEQTVLTDRQLKNEADGLKFLYFVDMWTRLEASELWGPIMKKQREIWRAEVDAAALK